MYSGKNLGRQAGYDGIPVAHVDSQTIAGMHTCEMILPVVEIVRPHAQIEIEDTDRVDLLYFLIAFAQRDMLGDGFGYAVKDAFEVMHFAGVLNFDDDNLTFAVQGFDIDTVEFVVGTFLVAFAFENFEDTNFFTQHNGQETVEHIEVGLLTQQTFDGPIEADIPVL